jgi:hypothetical protein
MEVTHYSRAKARRLLEAIVGSPTDEQVDKAAEVLESTRVPARTFGEEEAYWEGYRGGWNEHKRQTMEIARDWAHQFRKEPLSLFRHLNATHLPNALLAQPEGSKQRESQTSSPSERPKSKSAFSEAPSSSESTE